MLVAYLGNLLSSWKQTIDFENLLYYCAMFVTKQKEIAMSSNCLMNKNRHVQNFLSLNPNVGAMLTV